MGTRTVLTGMTIKIRALFLVFLFSALSSLCFAEEKTAGQKKEPFKASTLWGIRRGPNAPKQKEQEKPKTDAEADRMNKYYEDKAKGTYAGASGGSTSASSSSASCSLTSKPK